MAIPSVLNAGASGFPKKTIHPKQPALQKADTAGPQPKDGNTKMAIDKQKDIGASGMRIFTGPVEKVLKWHKALQETGVNSMFEVIAKCVSIRSGSGCEKHLLLRDASGPVLQATYYEIDFLLPDIKTGSTIRVIGTMVSSNRLRALKVRPAMASELSSLPRLCAISQHVVAKLQAQHHH